MKFFHVYSDSNLKCRKTSNRVYIYVSFTNQYKVQINLENNFYLVENMWRPWSNWTECDAECGGGLRYRFRTCMGNEICSGPRMESQVCNVAPCRPCEYHAQTKQLYTTRKHIKWNNITLFDRTIVPY